jgi:hypothetical protein
MSNKFFIKEKHQKSTTTNKTQTINSTRLLTDYGRLPTKTSQQRDL